MSDGKRARLELWGRQTPRRRGQKSGQTAVTQEKCSGRERKNQERADSQK